MFQYTLSSKPTKRSLKSKTLKSKILSSKSKSKSKSKRSMKGGAGATDYVLAMVGNEDQQYNNVFDQSIAGTNPGVGNALMSLDRMQSVAYTGGKSKKTMRRSKKAKRKNSKSSKSKRKHYKRMK